MDHRNQENGNDASGKAIVIQVHASVNNSHIKGYGRVKVSGQKTCQNTEFSGYRSQSSGKEKGQKGRWIVNCPFFGKAAQKNACHNRGDIAQVFSDVDKRQAKVTVLDQEGNLVFSSDPGERTSYSRRLLECIPGLQGDSWFRGAALPEDSQGERYLITRIQYDESGWAQVTGYLLLNKELQVVEGNLFPGRSFFSPEEFQYLQGKDSSGREIYRQEYKNGDGENRILLLHFFQPGNEEYQKVYDCLLYTSRCV